MITSSYDIVARICMVSSLLLFVAIFAAILVYVIRYTRADTYDKTQASALDLPDKSAIGDRA